MYEDDKGIQVTKIQIEVKLLNSGETECSQAFQKERQEARANGLHWGMVCISFTTVKSAKTPWEAGQVPCINVQVSARLHTLPSLLPWQRTPLNHNDGSRKQPALHTNEALNREEVLLDLILVYQGQKV